MRNSIAILGFGLGLMVVLMGWVGSVEGAEQGFKPELGNSRGVKDDSHVLMNQSWDRDGGEDMASAVNFTAIPFYDTGATCDNVNDYDVACPYTGSTSADVVYSFTPAMDMSITIDLDGSGYDTKVYVLDGSMNVIACNDDSHLPGYVSYLEEAVLMGGVEYFLVVDGYGGDCGDFVINVTEFIPPEPCVLTCDGVLEGEPAMVEGYVDNFNGGCNADNSNFLDMSEFSQNGTLDFCGVGGWYITPDGSETRDTDWLVVTIGETGRIEWTLDAESATVGYLLDIPDCDNVTVPASMAAGPCMPETMVIEGTPGDVAYLFVASSSYTQGAAGHPTNEYAYMIHFEGLMPTNSISVFVAIDGDDVLGDGSQGNPYASLGKGVFEVETGGAVYVGDGVYSGPDNCNVTVEHKLISIQSESNDPELCIFELAGENGLVINMGEDDVDIEVGLNLYNISFNGGDHALSLSGNNSVGYRNFAIIDINNCKFSHNSSGINLYFCRGEIQDCNFVENVDFGVLGYSEESFTVDILGCHFDGNGTGLSYEQPFTAHFQCSESVFVRNEIGLVYSTSSCHATFTSCRMDSNITSGFTVSGSAQSNVSFVDCQVLGNNIDGGMVVGGPEWLSFNNCEFSNNGNHGLNIQVSGSDLSISDVIFENNGGDGCYSYVSDMYVCSISRCTFANNRGDGLDNRSLARITDCLMVDNDSLGINYSYDSPNPVGSIFSNCTIVGNGGSGFYCEDGFVNISNCIVAFNEGSGIIPVNVENLELSCNDIYGNSINYQEELQQYLGQNGNINVNPAFCGTNNPDSPYTLSQNSPCAPDNNKTCDLMGALPIGCGDFQAEFMDVTSNYPGLIDWGSGNSVTWVDSDNDGDLDLSLGAGGNYPNRFFKNYLTETGEVSFVLSNDPELSSELPTRGNAWGLFNWDDSFPDLYLGVSNDSNVLLNNTGSSFSNVTNSVTAGSGQSTNGIRFVDYNNDGLLDIHELISGSPDRLLRNLGNWTFENVAASPLSLVEGSVDAAWCDVDADGDQDVYISRNGYSNVLLRNDGGGYFVDVTPVGLDDSNISQGVTWGDYDNDGLLDLFFTNWGSSDRLFHNDGDFEFTEVLSPFNETILHGQSPLWADFDNDGDLDLYVTNYGETNQFYVNNGNGQFVETAEGDLASTGSDVAAACADFDRDGDLDIFVGWHMGSNRLLQNESTSGFNWLDVKLVGNVSNPSAIGARVTVSSGGLQQTREVGANNGMWSQNPHEQHFGLRVNSTVDYIEVRWPSGITSTHEVDQVNQLVTIQEPTHVPLPYYEDFNDDVANRFLPHNGTWEIIDGAYHCYNDVPAIKQITAVGDTNWANYRLELDINSSGAPYQEVLVRYQSPEDWYVITIVPAPYNLFSLYKRVDGSEHMLVSGSFNNIDEVWNHMVVEVNGPIIRALFNGEEVFSYLDSDNPFLNGGIGLSAFAANSPFHDVSFDNIQVEELETDTWATFAPTESIIEHVGCSSSQPVVFQWDPTTSTAAINAYSVRVVGEGDITFSVADVNVFTVPADETFALQISENGPNDVTIAYNLTNPLTPGIATASELFSIDVHGVSEGEGLVRVVSTAFSDLDDNGVPVEYSAQAIVHVDCTPPGAATEVSAETGHHKVTLNWTQPGDADYGGAVIFRAYWENGSGESAYPTYGLPGGDVIPPRPADLAAAEASSQWELAGDVDAGALTFVDMNATRGLIFYEVFASDIAGNAHTPAAGQVMAANYWLGDMDVSRDGEVTIADLSTLGATYGAHTGETGFNNEADVGPTDDGSSMGIPQPDGYIGFDDLMIVSLNYESVDPSKSASHSAGPVTLSWEKVSEKEWLCRLESSGGSFKGLHLEGSLPSGVRATCVAGELISRQDGPVFLRNGNPAGLDIGLAVMGKGVVFEEAGDLLRVVLSAPADLSEVVIEARGADNEVIGLSMESSNVSDLPSHHQLRQNYPNPFNPMTTVSFDLPKDGKVRVNVYSVDGRLVKILAAGRYEAGSHDLIWKGEDDAGRRVASGTYFARMDCGDFSQIVKMVLAK